MGEKFKKKSNFFRSFFQFFFVSGKSHSAENCKWGPLGVFEHPFFCNIEKKWRGTLWRHYLRRNVSRNNLHKKVLVWSRAGLEPSSFCLADLKKSLSSLQKKETSRERPKSALRLRLTKRKDLFVKKFSCC